MSNYREIWPLAFVLAMASGSSQAGAPTDTDPAAFFRAGSLADTSATLRMQARQARTDPELAPHNCRYGSIFPIVLAGSGAGVELCGDLY